MKRHLEPSAAAIQANQRFLSARDEIARGILAASEPVESARILSAVTDDWLRELWEAAGSADASMVALGGYGRRELCLGSDLDLVIEAPEGAETADLQECVQRFVAWARLTRVKLAHAVRTPGQTHAAISEDFRTAVSYLDVRPLSGDPFVLADDAVDVLREKDEGRGFVKVLLEGHRARLDRFGQTIYLLEPDVKAGKGGLRDVHVVRWAARVRGGCDAERSACAPLGWTASDAAALRAGHEWLIAVRSLLHALHGRKHDRLHFPDQEAIARVLIDRDAPAADAAEVLMRRHYQTTRTIGKFAERTLRRWGPSPGGIECQVDEVFRVGGEQLAIDSGAPLSRDRVLEALRVAAEYDVLLDPVAEQRIERAVLGWGGDVVEDAAACSVVCGLLTDERTSPRTSGRLLELGILSRIVPEFEPVVCHVQHDVYHVYTTDTHLIRCLEFARSLRDSTSKVARAWPSFGAIAAEIEDSQVFLLSALFHDIGKNRGGGHSEKGAAMMLEVGPRLGLSDDRTSLLSFLVREHLTLAHVARRHDISDRRLVRDLAGRIRTVEALNQLTALTFCDMSTVGRTAISDWNATLLLQLHERLATTIRHGVEEAWRLIERDVDGVRQWLLANVADGRSEVDAFIRDLPAVYLIESTRKALVRVFEAWRRGRLGESVVVATPDPDRGITEVIISAADTPGMLAEITGGISSLGLNILDARIVTTSGGRLLDIFQVAQSGGSHAIDSGQQSAVTDERRLERVRALLLDLLNGAVTAEELLRRRRAERKLAPRTTPEVDTSVEELVDVSDSYTVVQVKAPDRLGLLNLIARTLADCRVDIRLSKIDSLGTQVIDTFYLETLDGEKLPADVVTRVIENLRIAVSTES